MGRAKMCNSNRSWHRATYMASLVSRSTQILEATRSPGFTRDYVKALRGTQDELATGTVEWWRGDKKLVQYRQTKEDISTVFHHLFSRNSGDPLWLPRQIDPKVILDVGAGIGVSSRYLAHRYPKAWVFAFEAIPGHLEILKRNAGWQKRIMVCSYGLGTKNMEYFVSSPGTDDGEDEPDRPLVATDRSGVKRRLERKSGLQKIQIREIKSAFKEAGIKRADVIRLDLTGGELELLMALPPEILRGTAWIYGTLHTDDSMRHLDFKALNFLSEWFEIDVHKPMGAKRYAFDACNRQISASYKSFQRERKVDDPTLMSA